MTTYRVTRMYLQCWVKTCDASATNAVWNEIEDVCAWACTEHLETVIEALREKPHADST